MIQMTVQVSNELAKRCQSAGPCLSAIIDLSFAGFKTPAAATVSEIIGFLSQNPSPEDLIGFHVSEPSQFRLRRLLALNNAGVCQKRSSPSWMQYLEHFVIMLKAQAGDLLKKEQ